MLALRLKSDDLRSGINRCRRGRFTGLIHPTLSADAELLHRALSNLVLNAMDAMPDGGMLVIAAARAGDAARLSVSDSGAGLTPEECSRLFTPYYTTRQHGTGLGLAIVQSVIADHHGTITAESGENGGARFVIELPLAAAERSV
jgi:two-component system, NtrC family, nitrogen regulation sensor histidine kinase NtrY